MTTQERQGEDSSQEREGELRVDKGLTMEAEEKGRGSEKRVRDVQFDEIIINTNLKEKKMEGEEGRHKGEGSGVIRGLKLNLN